MPRTKLPSLDKKSIDELVELAARRLATDYVNGNIGSVVDHLSMLPAHQAAAVALTFGNDIGVQDTRTLATMLLSRAGAKSSVLLRSLAALQLDSERP